MHLQPISCSTWKHTYHITEKAPQQDFEDTALSDPAKTSGFLKSGQTSSLWYITLMFHKLQIIKNENNLHLMLIQHGSHLFANHL